MGLVVALAVALLIALWFGLARLRRYRRRLVLDRGERSRGRARLADGGRSRAPRITVRYRHAGERWEARKITTAPWDVWLVRQPVTVVHLDDPRTHGEVLLGFGPDPTRWHRATAARLAYTETIT